MLRMHAKKDAKVKECPHAQPLPRWDNVDDIGDLSRVSRYYCSTCNSFLPPSPAPEPAGERR